MVPIPSLWLPILLSAVLVFVASAIIHMALGYHRLDFKRVANEDAAMDALRGVGLAPGDYMLPCPERHAAMNDPRFLEKMVRGPVAMMTVMKPGPPSMGPQLAQWFVYCLVIGVFAAYITGRALGPGAPYLAVFRFAGFTAFACHAVATWQQSIWYRRSWGTTLRYTIDGMVFGLLTAGTFGWLWPR